MSRRRATALIVLIACAVAASTACWSGGGGDDSGVELPPLTPFEPGLALRLAGIATDAASLRELDLNTEIEQGTLSREQLAGYYDAVEQKAREDEGVDIEGLNAAFRMLRMIGPGDDLLDIFTSNQSSDVLGFYSFEDKKLVLIAGTPGELSLDDEATLAHEYVHSFQDARFDLTKLTGLSKKDDDDDSSTEYSDAIDALTEGDATLAAGLYVLEKYGQEGLDRLGSDSEAPEEVAGPEIPAALERYFSFPYSYGTRFVRYLYDKGGWAEVDKAYKEPPRTEEQILHPEKYLAREGAIALKSADISDKLGTDWKRQDNAVFGEYDVYNWLLSVTGNETLALIGSEGWGGGRIVVYADQLDPGSVVLHLSLIWDTAADAREFYTAFAEVVTTLDPDPEVLDPSAQIVGWQNADQGGRAWAQSNSFKMVVATQPSDLEGALTLLDAPAEISKADYLD